MDRLARMKATIGYGASCNRVLPRVREVRPDPLLTRVSALAIQLIHYVQDVGMEPHYGDEPHQRDGHC
jgi:hypothetical protein